MSDHFTSRRQFATEKRDQPQRSSQAIAATRMRDKEGWVEQQIQAAIARGDFDNLPGSGKPLNDLGTVQDRDWWIKRLVEREHISGVLPAPLQLRKDDAELDDRLDICSLEADARRMVEDFNARVMHARYTPRDNQPPLITMPRDVEPTLAAWAGRRAVRRARLQEQQEQQAPKPSRRRWLSRKPRA